MIALYPLVLGASVIVALRRREEASPRGALGLGVWIVAGALFTFSFLTGLSIGLLLLPLAALSVLWAAWWAPHGAEAAGFAVGLGAVLALVAAIGHPGADWALGGAIAAGTGLVVFVVARARGARSAGPPSGRA